MHFQLQGPTSFPNVSTGKALVWLWCRKPQTKNSFFLFCLARYQFADITRNGWPFSWWVPAVTHNILSHPISARTKVTKVTTGNQGKQGQHQAQQYGHLQLQPKPWRPRHQPLAQRHGIRLSVLQMSSHVRFRIRMYPWVADLFLGNHQSISRFLCLWHQRLLCAMATVEACACRDFEPQHAFVRCLLSHADDPAVNDGITASKLSISYPLLRWRWVGISLVLEAKPPNPEQQRTCLHRSCAHLQWYNTSSLSDFFQIILSLLHRANATSHED